MNGVRPFRWLFIPSVLLLVAAPVEADGCKWPEPAYPAMPAIPAQRALVAWRGGVETLVVESTYETESPTVGWVLPLPAEPPELRAADPGMLTSLSMILRPEVTNDLSSGLRGVARLTLFGVAIGAVLVFVRNDSLRRGLVAALLIVLFFSFMLLGTAGVRHRGGLDGGAPEVTVVSTQRVGDYDVAVLKAETADALADWLTSEGLRTLDAKARTVVDDYVARGWCFAVARLVRKEGGTATGHPIAATFPAEKPVYPMKLTSLSGSRTRVELFVVADLQGCAEGFRTAAVDRYQVRPYAPFRSTHLAYPWQSQGAAWGINHHTLIGSPDALAYLWTGCVVTRLEADLAPEDMDHDVEIELVGLSSHRGHFFSARARRETACMVLLGGVIAPAAYCAVVFHARRRMTAAKLKGAGIVVLAAVVLAAWTWLALPVISTIPAANGGLTPRWAHLQFQHQVASLIDVGQLHSGMDEQELARLPGMIGELTDDPRMALNPYTGRPATMERSPGNFSVRRDEGKTWICTYDADGVEYGLELPPPKEHVSGGR